MRLSKLGQSANPLLSACASEGDRALSQPLATAEAVAIAQGLWHLIDRLQLAGAYTTWWCPLSQQYQHLWGNGVVSEGRWLAILEEVMANQPLATTVEPRLLARVRLTTSGTVGYENDSLYWASPAKVAGGSLSGSPSAFAGELYCLYDCTYYSWASGESPQPEVTVTGAAHAGITHAGITHAGAGNRLLVWTENSLSPLEEDYLTLQVKCWQQMLQAAGVQRQQGSQVADLEQALRSTRHQLQTPLALIQLQADLLSQQELSVCAQEQVLGIQKTAAGLQQSLQRLTQRDDFTPLASPHQPPAPVHRPDLQPQDLQPQDLQPQDLRSLVLAVLAELQPWLQAAQVETCLDMEACPLVMDAWQITQVIQNLLTNAIAFSPPGSCVTCRCRRFQNEALLQIGDQGPGLSEEDLQHLFTPFYSKRPGGTGLGLAIAQKLVHHHHGSLWAENLPQGGAQFSLVLPRGG